MESEITYAEVKFKNVSPAEEVKVPQKKKKHEQHTQTYPPWLPWLISLLLLLVCVALVVALLVTHFSHREVTSCDKPSALQVNLTEWRCILAVPQGKGRAWKCCPEGWRRFQESCYYFSADLMPWNESKQNCSGMGSHLVVINTEAEQDFLRKRIAQQLKYWQQGSNFYIGLSAQEVGHWQWADRTPYNVTASFWRPDEPSNVTDEMCVVIHHKTENLRNWNDIPCSTRSYWICETAAVTM